MTTLSKLGVLNPDDVEMDLRNGRTHRLHGHALVDERMERAGYRVPKKCMVSIALRGIPATSSIRVLERVFACAAQGAGLRCASARGPICTCLADLSRTVGTADRGVRIGDDTIEATFEPSAMIFVSFDVQERREAGFEAASTREAVTTYPLSFKRQHLRGSRTSSTTTRPGTARGWTRC